MTLISVAILETTSRPIVAILENDADEPARYPCRMLSEWLQKVMDAAGVSQAHLARELTEALGRSIDRAAVNKMRSGGRKISADELVAITRILRVKAPVEPPQTEGLRTVIVAAHVQAGLFSESWEWNEDDQYPVAIPDDPALRGYRLYAAETRGPSMNRRWPEGTVVVFTNAAETLESPIPGRRYVVEKRRQGGDAEHTVKLLHQDGDGKYWLVPESNDPRYQAPIAVDDGADDEYVVTIVGRVWFAVSRE